MIGDCIHNMRAALDHLFWALILLKNPSGVRASDAIFPILRDRTTFKGRKAKIENWVGKDVAAMIERMQPYNGAGPDQNALLFIHTSDIADKHKLLIPFLGVVQGGQVRLQLANESTPMPDFPTEFVAGALEDNAKIAEVRVSPPEAVVDVDIDIALNVIFESMAPNVYVVTPSLESLIGVVESVAADFASQFAGHSSAP